MLDLKYLYFQNQLFLKCVSRAFITFFNFCIEDDTPKYL